MIVASISVLCALILRLYYFEILFVLCIVMLYMYVCIILYMHVSIVIVFIFVHVVYVYCSGAEERHLPELKLLINKSINALLFTRDSMARDKKILKILYISYAVVVL